MKKRVEAAFEAGVEEAVRLFGMGKDIRPEDLAGSAAPPRASMTRL